MALGKAGIVEVYDVIYRHLPEKKKLRLLLRELSTTQAYQRNASFRGTLNRLHDLNENSAPSEPPDEKR